MTTNPSGSGIGSGAADAEQAEAEEEEAEAAAAAALEKATATATLAESSPQNFPSLKEAVTAKPKKKKMTLAEFRNYTVAPTGSRGGGRGGAGEYARLTDEDMLRLPTGPKERSAEEMQYRLGSGFRNYGTRSVSGGGSDGGGGGNRRKYASFDEERIGAPSRFSDSERKNNPGDWFCSDRTGMDSDSERKNDLSDWTILSDCARMDSVSDSEIKKDTGFARPLKKLHQELEEADSASEIKKDKGANSELEDLQQKLRSATIKEYKVSLPVEKEEAESPPSQSHLADPLPALSSTKWKRLYLKIVESEIKEAESLPSDLLPEPSEMNKLYFFFWHAYSPVMYSLYEVDVPIPLPPPPSKAVQDDRISNPKSLSPILQLKTGKYADGMCCLQLGSILYFLGGEMNIDNPYIDEDVKKELKNVEPDVLPKVVYIFDLAIDRELKDNDNLLAGTPMNYGKASPLAFVADEKIYVIGSTIQDLEGDRIPYFEMFDPKVDKWSVLENPPEIKVNTIWVGHAVVGRKALLVGWRRKKRHLYCFDLDTCEWASISIPDYAGNFSGNTEFVGNTFYGCYYDTVAAIAPDELKEEEAEEKDFQQMFKHHRLLQVSEDLGMDAIFNVPPQLQYSSNLLHLGKMYFCYVRTGMPPHPDPILASDLVIGDDKKRFISIVIFQAIGETCESRFFRAKFLHSEHYVVDSPFPNDGFIRGCYVFGSGSTESSKQISI